MVKGEELAQKIEEKGINAGNLVIETN